MANQRSKDKRVVSVPMEKSLIQAIDKFAAEAKLFRAGAGDKTPDRTAAIKLFCRINLGMEIPESVLAAVPKTVMRSIAGPKNLAIKEYPPAPKSSLTR